VNHSEYLDVAKDMDLDILDFMIDVLEFRERFLPIYFYPFFQYEIRLGIGIKDWAERFQDIIKTETEEVVYQVELAEIELNDMDFDKLGRDEILMYIEANPYVTMLFERLKKYVDLFSKSRYEGVVAKYVE